MSGNGFDGWGATMLLRLAAVCCALVVSVAAVSAQTRVPSDSRLKSIVAKKVIRIALARKLLVRLNAKARDVRAQFAIPA